MMSIKKTFKGEFTIIYGFTIDQDHIVRDHKFFINEKIKTEFEKQKLKGFNPEIFTYQFIPEDDFGLTLLKMTFFEGATILVLFINEDADLNAVQQAKQNIEREALNSLAEIVEVTNNVIKLEKLNNYLTKFPPSTYYYSLKAATHSSLKQYKEAKKDYLNALVLDINNTGVLNNLGQLYEHKFDNKEEAKACYEKALAIDPNFTISRLNLGTLLERKFEDKDAAKDQYEIILSYEPNEVRAHNNLGNYYRRFSDDTSQQKAISYFESAIAINAEFIDGYINYGSFLQEINNKEKSKEVLQIARRLNKSEHVSKLIDRLLEQANR